MQKRKYNRVSQPERYVMTVGCFDCFHYGHKALLDHMRDYGDKFMIGIHDNESIYINKQLKVLHSLDERKRSLRDYLKSKDAPNGFEIFDISEPDPTKAMTEIYNKYQRKEPKIQWNYMRGSDMINFPGREYIASVMPIIWHKYTEGISSTIIREQISDDVLKKCYHCDDVNNDPAGAQGERCRRCHQWFCSKIECSNWVCTYGATCERCDSNAEKRGSLKRRTWREPDTKDE